MGLYDRDYMRSPGRGRGRRRNDHDWDDDGGGARPNYRWVWVAVVAVVVLAAGWWMLQHVAMTYLGMFDNFPRPKLLATRTVELGTFEVVSGEVAVCDPGFDRAEVNRGEVAKKIDNVAKGRWQARVVRHTIDNPGLVLCAELIAFPVDRPLPDAPDWQKIHDDIGIDSGVAGFFDWQHFHSRAAVPADYPWKGQKADPADAWYSMCCDVTENSADAAGVIPFGVVAESGWGEGGYVAYALRDPAGTVVGLRIVFLGEGEYER